MSARRWLQYCPSPHCRPQCTYLSVRLARFADPQALSGDLLGIEDMPRLCKPEHWARLLALRDARLSLESDAAQLGNSVQLLSDQLVVLQDEQACLVSQLEAAEQVQCCCVCLLATATIAI